MKALKTAFIALAMLGLLLPAILEAAEGPNVGSMVALRGKALIHRGPSGLAAKVKDGVRLQDVIETQDSSRAKVLFIDESMLTLAANSKASIEQFVYSKEGGGASIFNLLDGAMRSVVGKTAFEVHTSTSVAAARGTVIEFFTGKVDGKPFTKINCLEGSVLVKSPDPNIVGKIVLNAGHTVTITEGAPLPKPKPLIPGGEAGQEDNGEGDDGSAEGDEGSSEGDGSEGNGEGDGQVDGKPTGKGKGGLGLPGTNNTGSTTTTGTATTTTTTTTATTSTATTPTTNLPPIDLTPATNTTKVTIKLWR